MTTTTVGFNQISAGLTINAVDTVDVLFGGTVVSTTVSGTLDVFSGGTAIDTTVEGPFGEELVWNGGTAINTNVKAGGQQFVEFGGTAAGTVVFTGSLQRVVGGTASNTFVFGTEEVFDGGTAIDSFVFGNGSIEEVFTFGAASGTIVEFGGTVEVFGGTTSGTDVFNGGTEDVGFGGITIGTTVNGGGFEDVLNFGTASATTINGGKVEVESGGSIGSGPITFTNAGGILQLDDAQHFHGLIAGFASPPGVMEEIDLADISFGKKTKVSFKEAQDKLSGTLTVTDGTHTASLTLLGQYSAQDFSLASDGNGGTMVTDPQHHPSLVGSAASPILAPPA